MYPEPPTNLLNAALQPKADVFGVSLREVSMGDLKLPSGSLVACDAIVFSEPKPFDLKLPVGDFPASCVVARFDDGEEVIAFAVIRISTATPRTWSLLEPLGYSHESRWGGQFPSYSVDSGLGCFTDAETATAVNSLVDANHEWYRTILAKFEDNGHQSWKWANLPVSTGTLISFTSGFGDGIYATYAGLDDNGNVAAVVSDFAVIPLPED
jgi:hypothetical protein